MRTIVFGICLLLSTSIYAQRNCGTQSYIEVLRSAQPQLQNKLSNIEAFLQRQKMNFRVDGNFANPVIVIPVIVHVIYNDGSQNLSDDQVKSQVDALNRDFRRLNQDTSLTPQRFKAMAADVSIEFKLATADPFGRPTTGIIHKKTSLPFWKTDDKIKYNREGGDDAWDSRYYLNIWVGNIQSVIGYSSVPGCDAATDGVVIATSVFGTLNRSGTYNMGRTAVHEVGHWLGLKHIWGDYYCGDDGVDDTPVQGNFTPGCPNTFRSSCSNGSLGDMYMNYMDYTGDACMNLFTNGQKLRMRSMFYEGGPRAGLLSSKGLNEPWMAEAPPVTIIPSAAIFPNPAMGDISINLDDSWIGSTIRIADMNGVVLSTFNITARIQKVPVAHLKQGMYLVQGDNGKRKLREKFIRL